MTKNVIIIGGEGNGGVIASCIEDNRLRFGDDGYVVEGFMNDFLPPGSKINGYPVLSGTDGIGQFMERDSLFMYAIHIIGRGPLRERIYTKISIPPERLAVIVHKSAFISPNAVLEPGAFVMANCYVGPATRIGQCSLVMANSVVGHNDEIGPFNHISAGSIMSSYVKTGKYADVCLGARIMEKLTMGDYSVAGAGSLVLKDIPSREVHVGSPARFLRRISEEEYG